MDHASARQLAQTGMLFYPSDSRTAPRPDAARIHDEMAAALRQAPSDVPVPLIVEAPSYLFDEVWRALAQGVWSKRLETEWFCVRRPGEILFVPRK